MDGVEVVAVEQSAESAAAVLRGGERIYAPVVIGADGYRSVVRHVVNPEQPCSLYAGYLLWQGLVFEADLPPNTPWPQSEDGVALVNTSGYRLVAYPVANASGSSKPGKRMISFTWYDASRTTLLEALGCLSPCGGVRHSLAPARIPPAVLDELFSLASRIWPEPWRAAILLALKQQKLFATPVAEYYPERLQHGRLVIIGDAAHLTTPATGGGFVAGVLDAKALADCLELAFSDREPDITAALQRYEESRLPSVQGAVSASRKWSREFVAASPYRQNTRRVKPEQKT